MDYIGRTENKEVTKKDGSGGGGCLLCTPSLACQRKSQTIDYFEMQILYDRSFDLHFKDYRSEKLTHNDLPSFFVVL